MDLFPIAAELRPDIFLQVAQLAIVFLFSISFHESAHAWMADRCGDDTARLMGRMTLNPIVHIDPIGTVLIPGIMVLRSLSMLGSGMPAMIGWAKPVPVNPLRYRDYRKGELLVSLAGPVSNLILLIGGAIVLRLMLLMNLSPKADPIFDFFFFFVSLNMILFMFNLMPIYPLDGSHILKLVLSREAAEAYDRYISPYGILIILIFVNTPVFGFLYSTGISFVKWFILLGLPG